jgi:hypothetical protein
MFRILPVVIMLTAVPAVVFSQGNDATAPSILTHSPFLPPGFQPPGGAGTTTDAPASPSQYEFHGVYQLGGLYYFHLYNTRERKGSWTSKEASGGDQPRIVEFDKERDTLVIEVSGERVSLNLMETSDQPMAMARVSRPPQAAKAAATEPGAEQPGPPRRRIIRPTIRPSGTPAAPIRRPTIETETQPPSQP